MTVDRTRSLIWRLFLTYLAALFAGSSFLVLNNLVINHRTFRSLLTFNLPFIFISDFIMAAILLAVSYWRLKPALPHFRAPAANGPNGQPPEEAFLRLMRFPMELFWGLVVLAALFICLYHAAEWMAGHAILHELSDLYRLIYVVLMELSIALILAVLLLSSSRRLLRAYAVRLHIRTIPDSYRRSASRMIAINTAFCFIITFAAAVRVVIQTPSPAFPVAEYAVVTGIYAIFAMTIFAMFLLELRTELGMLVKRLYELAGERTSALQLHQTVPIVSLDETGGLTSALNRLQHRVASSYEDVRRQLALSYAVQQKLLPRSLPKVDHVDIAVSCRQSQSVGGDFYDIIPLGQQRWAVAVGDVSGKGLPAALLMSAVMMGLRTEVQKRTATADIVARLNRHMYQMTQGQFYSTLGLAFIDCSFGQTLIEYVSAGHLDPYSVRNRTVTEWSGSSLPLGIAPDTTYIGRSVRLEPGDLVVLYTDGIIETRDASGRMLGFERWERQLAELSPQAGAEEQLGQLMDYVHSLDAAEPADDRTVILLKRHASSEREAAPPVSAEWTMKAEYGGEKTILQHIRATIARVAPDEQRLDDILTSVAEALLNAIEHGDNGDESNDGGGNSHSGSSGNHSGNSGSHSGSSGNHSGNSDSHSGGNGGETAASPRIRCSLTITDAAYQFRIRDHGAVVPPIPQELPLSDKWLAEQPRGWGLFLIHRLSDRFEFRLEQGRVCAVITFFR